MNLNQLDEWQFLDSHHDGHQSLDQKYQQKPEVTQKKRM